MKTLIFQLSLAVLCLGAFTAQAQEIPSKEEMAARWYIRGMITPDGQFQDMADLDAMVDAQMATAPANQKSDSRVRDAVKSTLKLQMVPITNSYIQLNADGTIKTIDASESVEPQTGTWTYNASTGKLTTTEEAAEPETLMVAKWKDGMYKMTTWEEGKELVLVMQKTRITYD